MIRKVFVGLLVLALGTVLWLQNAENARLKAENGNISASLVASQAEVGKVRAENMELEKRISNAEGKIAVLQMVASWYGPGFHGRTAADGSKYDQFAFTVAHKTLPFGTVLVVEGANGHRIPVVVTDRGPFVKGRDIDLSYATAERVGLLRKGVGQVKVYQFKL